MLKFSGVHGVKGPEKFWKCLQGPEMCLCLIYRLHFQSFTVQNTSSLWLDVSSFRRFMLQNFHYDLLELYIHCSNITIPGVSCVKLTPLQDKFGICTRNTLRQPWCRSPAFPRIQWHTVATSLLLMLPWQVSSLYVVSLVELSLVFFVKLPNHRWYWSILLHNSSVQLERSRIGTMLLKPSLN